jgi:hypothetical protein
MKDRYGTWITAEGKLLPVNDLCGHAAIIPYEHGFDYGHISTIESREDHFYQPKDLSISIRLYALRSLTKRGLMALKSYVRKAKTDLFYIESLQPKYNYGSYQGTNKLGAIEIIDKLILLLPERFNEDDYDYEDRLLRKYFEPKKRKSRAL